MNLNNENKASRILDMYDKVTALLKDSEALLKNNRDDEKKNVESELNIIKSQWTSCGLGPHLFPRSVWQSVKDDFSNLDKSKKFFERVNYLRQNITEIVCDELKNEVHNLEHISKTLAERIFNIYENDRYTKYITSLVLDTVLKCAVSAPKLSYDYAMKLFRNVPDILSEKGNIHEGYVYNAHKEQRIFEKCPICGGESEPYYCSFSYRMQHFDNPFEPFKLWMKCSGCGNLHTWKFPKEYLAMSSNDKIVTPSEESLYRSLNITYSGTLSIWSSILNKLRSYTDKKTLLEVGIGRGELLAVALEMGYEPNAVEIIEERAQEVSDILNIPIWNGDFLNFKSDKTFSIITMGDVIEHVIDPEAALKNAYRLLDDDGVLWLSTPNFESSFTRLKKFTDPMWCEPHHITYFNNRGFEALLEKCGFAVREYLVSSRYNGSMELIITKK